MQNATANAFLVWVKPLRACAGASDLHPGKASEGLHYRQSLSFLNAFSGWTAVDRQTRKVLELAWPAATFHIYSHPFLR